MNHTKYAVLSNLPKMIFSFISSFIICYFILGVGFMSSYLLIPLNSISPVYFFSSEMFEMYKILIITFLVHSSIYSLIYCIIDIWYLDDDFETTRYTVNNEKISKELFLKVKLLKHIPIFALLNGLSYLIRGKTIIDKKYNITYNFENENVVGEKVIRKYFLILLVFLTVQFIGSGITFYKDSEIQTVKYLSTLETVKSVNSSILVDNDSGQFYYNLNVYLEDGYIHYNKLTYALDEIKNNLKKSSDFIVDKYNKRIGEVVGFNIVVYNEYSKTWDKYMYNKDLSEVYELKDISDNISDIDIYIKDNSLVYNILTNLSKDEIGWDMAEFMLNEFEADILSEEIQAKIKNILNIDRDIDRYVINILSKEYYTSKNNTYFVYIKNVDDIDWFYYDNGFYSLEKKEEDFEYEVLNLYKNTELDFKNLYDSGEIHIISEEDIVLEDIYKLLNNTDAGKTLKRQVEHTGKVSEIKFVIEGDIS